MYASEIVKYARSLANMPKADAISWNDEMSSLDHSYKDVYARIAFAKAAYDYMTVGPVLLDLSTAVQLGTTGWTVTLPKDVYSLRYVDYNRNGFWTNMEIFNINERNFVGGSPKYRWLGDKLWITGVMPAQIRIRYFPPPMVPSVPDVSYQYALQYQIYELPGVASPQYFSLPDPVNEGDNDYCLYVYNRITIVLESYMLQSELPLYTATGITQCWYWLGYIYYLMNGNIYRATTNLVTLGTATEIVAGGNVTTFSITGNNKLVWSTVGNTYIASLDGSDSSVLYTYPTRDVCLYGSNSYAYISAESDGLFVDTTYIGGMIVQNIASDTQYVYYLDQGGTIHRLTLDAELKVLGDYILYTGMQYLGSYWDHRVAVVDNQFGVYAVSTYVDTNFDYPLNDGFEIIAYQSAIDYKRKEVADYSQLEQRLNEIWARFELTLKRDSGKPEHRIADSVKNNTGFFY